MHAKNEQPSLRNQNGLFSSETHNSDIPDNCLKTYYGRFQEPVSTNIHYFIKFVIVVRGTSKRQ